MKWIQGDRLALLEQDSGMARMKAEGIEWQGIWIMYVNEFNDE